MVGISVAVVSFGASAITAPLTAGADQAATTKDQIRAVQAQVAIGASQIRTLTLAYDQASIRAADLAQQVAVDQAELSQLRQKLAASRTALIAEAIIGYTGGSGSPSGAVVTLAAAGTYSALSDPSVRAEYLQVAAGNVNDIVDQFRSEEQLLGAAQANLTRQESASQAAAAATAASRQQALSTASSEQSQLDQLQANLNQIQAAAARAAQAPPAPPTQGLPVNNGLVAVVRAIVAPPAPQPVPAPQTAPVTAPPPPVVSGGAGGVWLQLRECESGDNYRANTGNGFYGAYQFSAQTWADLGYPGRPDLESPAMQDQAAMKLESESGWGQWPACAAALGLH